MDNIQDYLNKEIIETAKKMNELCYTIEDFNKCPLIDCGCNEQMLPYEWKIK